MTTRIVKSEYGRKRLIEMIEAKPFPFTVTIADGEHRSAEQNRLQFMWMKEISRQREDMRVEEIRGYCKLAIGVPILREENEAFRLKYDEHVKPLPYEQKLSLMMEPLDMPVTRIMTVKQKSRYLDGIYKHFTEQGVVLTLPPDQMFAGAA